MTKIISECDEHLSDLIVLTWRSCSYCLSCALFIHNNVIVNRWRK